MKIIEEQQCRAGNLESREESWSKARRNREAEGRVQNRLSALVVLVCLDYFQSSLLRSSVLAGSTDMWWRRSCRVILLYYIFFW